MGYRYENFDKVTESWIRVKDTEVKKGMRLKIIDSDERTIVEGRVKELERVWVGEETKGIEHLLMDLNIEFDVPIPKEEVFTEAFNPTAPPWKG